MKLRETLIDNGESGDEVTMPEGLSKYPNNILWYILNALSGLFLLILIPVYSYKK